MTDNTTQSDYPEAINKWLDEAPGNTFTWELVGYDEAPSRFSNGKDVTIATFADEKEVQHSLWLSTTVLVSQFARAKPKRGEKVTVAYLGKKGENDYKDYRVTCPDRPPFEPDWDAMKASDAEDWKEEG